MTDQEWQDFYEITSIKGLDLEAERDRQTGNRDVEVAGA